MAMRAVMRADFLHDFPFDDGCDDDSNNWTLTSMSDIGLMMIAVVVASLIVDCHWQPFYKKRLVN